MHLGTGWPKKGAGCWVQSDRILSTRFVIGSDHFTTRRYKGTFTRSGDCMTTWPEALPGSIAPICQRWMMRGGCKRSWTQLEPQLRRGTSDPWAHLNLCCHPIRTPPVPTLLHSPPAARYPRSRALVSAFELSPAYRAAPKAASSL
jgi:hypothetical protein